MTPRQVYAARRVSLAVDRMIRSEAPLQARAWVRRWAYVAGLSEARPGALVTSGEGSPGGGAGDAAPATRGGIGGAPPLG